MNARDRKALLTGATVIIGAWLLFGGVPRLWRWSRELRERTAAEVTRLEETRAAIAALPRMEDSARTLTGRVARIAPQILSGSDAPVALSDLGARMGTLASLSHGQLARIEPLADSTAAGPLKRVSAMAVLETDFRGVAELLDRIARESLVIIPGRAEITPVDAPSSGEQAERLELRIRISAWYLARGSGS